MARKNGGFIYPAHAGINQRQRWKRKPSPYLPRTRGDKPVCTVHIGTPSRSTPHTRG